LYGTALYSRIVAQQSQKQFAASVAVTHALHDKEAAEKETEENVTFLNQISGKKGLLASCFLVFE